MPLSMLLVPCNTRHSEEAKPFVDEKLRDLGFERAADSMLVDFTDIFFGSDVLDEPRLERALKALSPELLEPLHGIFGVFGTTREPGQIRAHRWVLGYVPDFSEDGESPNDIELTYGGQT